MMDEQLTLAEINQRFEVLQRALYDLTFSTVGGEGYMDEDGDYQEPFIEMINFYRLLTYLGRLQFGPHPLISSVITPDQAENIVEELIQGKTAYQVIQEYKIPSEEFNLLESDFSDTAVEYPSCSFSIRFHK